MVSKTDEFIRELGPAQMRIKMSRKKKATHKKVPIKLAADQARFVVAKPASQLTRDELYARNMRLAQESAEYDREKHEERLKRNG